MYFKIATLGCKVNQYESEWLREALLQLGFVEVAEGGGADLVIVNTCTVTAESDLKSRKIIRKLARENRNAQLIAMGCSATRNPVALAEIDGVTKVITDKKKLPEFLAALGLREIPTGVQQFGERHRAYVKVQDGCRVGCSYCIIPKVRPELRSRPIEEVLAEIQALSQNGYREIVMTGIHLGHYGIDFPSAHAGDFVDCRGAARIAAALPSFESRSC